MKIDKENQIDDMAEFLTEGARPWYADAEALYNAGYRKASDVARAVIEEAIELARQSADEAKVRADKEANVLLRAELRGQQIGGNIILCKLTKLKKKYTEGEE